MTIRRAKLKDLVDIQYLQSTYSAVPVTQDYLNDLDISLVVESQNKIVGFLWAALSCNKTRAHLEHLYVDPNYSGIAKKLYNRFCEIAKHKKVEQVISYIHKGPYADELGSIALTAGAKAIPAPAIRVELDLR